MTVGELIEELQRFDPNMIVIVSNQEDSSEPSCNIRKFNFESCYWFKFKLEKIPANQEFLEIT